MRVKTGLHQVGDDSFVIDFPALLPKILYFFFEVLFFGTRPEKKTGYDKTYVNFICHIKRPF